MTELPLPETPHDEHERLKAENAVRLKRYQEQGIPVSLIPNYLDFLTETLIPDDDERLAFRLGWERKVVGLLDEVDARVARARLLVPGSPS
jgi:hypothetical protein